MKQSRREKYREETRQEIKDLAWQQIAEQGAAALSLRAIAREMGMTAPALYRYYPNRDALVTELIVDAYHGLGAALEDARQASTQAAPLVRIFELGLAYRDWALQHPQRYALIFGTPLPGYQAPFEITQPAAAEAMQALVTTILDAYGAQALEPAALQALISPELQGQLAGWGERLGLPQQADPNLPALLYLVLAAWVRIHGLVALELDHQFQDLIGDASGLVRAEMLALLRQADGDIHALNGDSVSG